MKLESVYLSVFCLYIATQNLRGRGSRSNHGGVTWVRISLYFIPHKSNRVNEKFHKSKLCLPIEFSTLPVHFIQLIFTFLRCRRTR